MKTCNSFVVFGLVVAMWPSLAAAQLQLLPLPGQPAAEARPTLQPANQPLSQSDAGFRQFPSQPVVQAQSVQPLSQPAAQMAPAAAQATSPSAIPASPASAAAESAAPVPSGRTAYLRAEFLGQAEEIFDYVEYIWNFAIFRAADGKTPLVTVGTLFGGLILMGCGYVAAGMISRWIGARLLSRFGLNQTARAPLQSISYYLLLIMFGMFTLNILNVPITVFSFAGGAIAVGVGFGSQNIINNFISGLILIAERPIRVGDVIEIDGRTGRVTEIGARSTRIATGSNFEVIVPNSKFLESQVVNWTLTDDRISSSVKVGVAYGSPTRDVERLLKQAADEHPLIMRDPGPGVSFEDFANDALVFSVSFWIHLQEASKGKVESDLRFRIDELFTQAGIVIAYPQRDVHLNVMRPLEVRLAPDATREFRRVAA